MFRWRVIIAFTLSTITLAAQSSKIVPQAEMEQIYRQVCTPYKYGLVVAPQTNEAKVDCPTVFRVGQRWFMTYLLYNGRSGKDGRGYETWLAQSDDLLHWKTLGRLLAFGDNEWDASQRGGFPALPDMEWGGSYTLQSFKNKFWMSYIGGASTGYEAGPLKVGMASTPVSNIGKAELWDCSKRPVLTPTDKDAQWFENITQYKSTVYWDRAKSLGAPFVMFYNAGGVNPKNKIKAERIGIALSDDMKHFRRYEGNPVFTHEEGITGDAHIQKFGDIYVMFYFSAFRADRPYKAFNTFACSYDMVNWSDWQGDDLIVPSKPYDNLFAHKSYLIKHNDVVYHFYCAVNKDDQRGIAVATSKPMGRSSVNFPAPESREHREIISLDKGWKTWMKGDTLAVDLPHNWDDYYGYRQFTHGNLHGTATYAKSFTIPAAESNKRYFIRLEGVGSYARVTLNGNDMGRHPVGRTTLTIDVTQEIKYNTPNELVIVAEHPEMITDMPWVCGGCSSEWGFSEGSQPLGIFRSVVLEVTDRVRVEPFGVHIWNDDKAETIYIETQIKNYSSKSESFELVSRLNDDNGIAVFRLSQMVTLAPGELRTLRQSSPIASPKLWSVERPYLYTLASVIKRQGTTTDQLSTPFGVRTISWPVKRNDGDGRFFLNGKPLFINGVCEYEHQFGASHSFSAEQVVSRVKQIKSTGFNAFRDAHQPHNLLYQRLLDEQGILSWSQLSAHIWYDTPEFRDNFKKMLRQWVKERRNSPSLVIWGLQNESTLPEDFAAECTEIIREMDPTARNMRIVATCNGGQGTDWNVVQNWSGTYGGKPEEYDKELAQPNQLLNGEYGAWRSLGLHTEPGEFEQNGIWSEDRMCRLLEMKIRLAEKVRDSVCGGFQWIYSSHDNPGRRQPDEAYRAIDKVGPFNYKGLVTPWEEPLDVYYMYRSNYISAAKEPMVYIVSHTWNDRFVSRCRATIEVYSNCDSVKLYNDATDTAYLGVKRRGGKGTHFMWENRDIRYNVLRAVGYYRGRVVAQDVITLNNLEQAPNFAMLHRGDTPMLKGQSGYNYLYRLNCGGDEYTDAYGQKWLKDDTTFSRSWASDFDGLNPYLASQSVTFDPIAGCGDWSLIGHLRYGRHKLNYTFAVPDGNYRVELYFVEPWHGTGAAVGSDCEGLRIFDVAINDQRVIDDMDIWAEVGHDVALKRVVDAKAVNGQLVISFPQTKAGQAVISAIAIATTDPQARIKPLPQSDWSWSEAQRQVLIKTPNEMLPEDKNARKSVVYQAESAGVVGKSSIKEFRKQQSVCFGPGQASIEWKITTGLAQLYALRIRYMNLSGSSVTASWRLVDAKGVTLRNEPITFAPTPEKWRQVSTTTGSYINAGEYRVIISAPNMQGLWFDSLEIE